MSIICKMNGALLTAPCSASACHFFGDCITDWKKTLARPQTNGDRLRNMSDEELAELLTTGKHGFDCFECRSNMHDCEADCAAGCLEWLRSAATEGR